MQDSRMKCYATAHMKHNLLHHLAMIVISEAINILWLLVGVAIAASGVAIALALMAESFYLLAVGLPLVLIGVSIIFFKIHEIILVIVRPKRLQAICIFCQKNG